MKILKSATNWLIGLFVCRHPRLTFPRKIDGKDYQVCLVCGARLPSKIQFG
jgi:hypothetical protein